VVAETERRAEYAASFGDISKVPQLEAAGLAAHPSLNYIAFIFSVRHRRHFNH